MFEFWGVFQLACLMLFVAINLFFDLYFVGTFLLNGTMFFALSAVFTVLNLHWQTLQEERHLSRRFGADYGAYRVRTARYWTGPWAVRKRGARRKLKVH
jgi:hypothetical protein